MVLVLCLCTSLLSGQDKFKTKPGMIFLGGGASIGFSQEFNASNENVLGIELRPLFGQFLTRDTLLFTHLGFAMKAGFTHQSFTGSLSIGAQGRYFFSTEETINIFLGLDIQFGLDLGAAYGKLNEHVLTGIVGGVFIPFNEKIGLDLSLTPLVYLPLNTYEPARMVIFTSVGILSTL